MQDGRSTLYPVSSAAVYILLSHTRSKAIQYHTREEGRGGERKGERERVRERETEREREREREREKVRKREREKKKSYMYALNGRKHQFITTPTSICSPDTESRVFSVSVGLQGPPEESLSSLPQYTDSSRDSNRRVILIRNGC
eukprot:sb/3474007/